MATASMSSADIIPKGHISAYERHLATNISCNISVNELYSSYKRRVNGSKREIIGKVTGKA